MTEPHHDPHTLVLRTRIFEPALWAEYGITSLTDLAGRMGLTTGALSRLRNHSREEPSALVLKGSLCAFPGKTLSELFVLEDA